MARFQPLIAATATAIALLALAATASAQARAPASPSPSVAVAGKKDADKQHRLILQVNTNDAAAMTLALNNAANVDQYYSDKGEPVEIEIITFGPGLHMLRDDTSPVKDRIKSMAESRPSVTFKACGNTQENMSKAEHKKIPLVSQASVVPSGVVRILELQEQGWSYVRP
jgi:intracellular sulfur oxidation DsrE/DsrF family protein